MTANELINALEDADMDLIVAPNAIVVFRDDDRTLHYIDRVTVEDGRVVLVGVTA